MLNRLLILLICATALTAQVDSKALSQAGKRSDWITNGRTLAEEHFSPLDEINDKNVERLGLDWSFVLDTRRGLEATPLVVDGVMYFSSVWSLVYAVDAKSGELRWKWDPKVPRSEGLWACCDAVNRGVAFYEGKVYIGVLDGRLAAIDAKTGETAWEVQTTDPDQPYTITGAPRIANGKVLIGNGGAEYGVRGFVSAYDAQTGNLDWRFYTVPGDPSKGFESPAMERAAKTWTGEWWTLGGGGTVWDSIVYDPELNLVYVGVGNGSPWDHKARSPDGGDNLYLCSIVALNGNTGELVWHYQQVPGETWDYTAVQPMMLVDLEIEGKKRKTLLQAPKNGFFYVLDRETGELISAEKIVPITWATHVDMKTGRPVEVPGARYLEGSFDVGPAPMGAHNWHAMSYSPDTGFVYIPAHQSMTRYTRIKDFEHGDGVWNLGIENGAPVSPPFDPPALLLAWDPVKQEERWRVPFKQVANGGTLATAGNLVFQGNSSGYFAAYRADDGKKLWETPVGTTIIAAPITYELEGRQYISVLASWGGALGLHRANFAGFHGVRGRMLTFTLDGKAEMPKAEGRTYPELTEIPFEAPREQIQQGARLYAQHCQRCHGIGTNSSGAIADLRRSDPAVFENYVGIVSDGNFEPLGMPGFKEWLDQSEIAAIKSYILDRRAALPK